MTSNKLNAVSMNLEVTLVCSILINNSAEIRRKKNDEREIPQMANICKYEDSFENGCEVKKDIFNILG